MTLIVRDNRICARCSSFTRKECTTEQLAASLGRRTAGWHPPIVPFVRWDARFCVLYAPAANQEERERFIRTMLAEQSADGGGAP